MNTCKNLEDLLDLFQRLVVQHMCEQRHASVDHEDANE